jgi:E3 ubiquitin-protein ligase MARCH6
VYYVSISICFPSINADSVDFIRDPDDPTFHPVRDVLNRPVTTQLRKIGFSAFIYGVLVLLCLGGVVWGLAGMTENVLPIHWSSSEPVFEFPVDLLFYNFLMPLAIKFFKPSDGLQNMYAWWFRKCARALRLTSFMFGERRPDEEGYTHYPTFASRWRETPDYEHPLKPNEVGPANAVYFKRDGRFVRAPASDSVRRPKGASVFIPVDEHNVRTDVDPSQDPPSGPTGANSPDWRLAYIPPYFRVRIGLVVLGIWFFAALTGVSVTIGPLLIGRALLRQFIPPQVKLNDIYAFSVGVYIIGGLALLLSKLPAAYNHMKALIAPLTTAASNVSTPEKLRHVGRAASSFLLRSIKISYLLTAFAIVIPTLVALLIEFYLIIPLHTAFNASAANTPTTSPDGSSGFNITTTPNTEPNITTAAPILGHTIHFVQDWTLGVLYVKMAGKMLLLDDQSRWARSLRGIVAPGWTNPDAKLATRVFIAPCIGYMILALTAPLALASGVVKLGWAEGPGVYRLAYPACAATVALGAVCYAVWKVVERWKEGVRDEVYLRGMRVHNHGEDRPPVMTTARRTITARG